MDNPEPKSIPEVATIKSMDELVARMAIWHKMCIKQAEHMMTIPEGTEAEYKDKKGRDKELKLTGKLLEAYKFGVMTGIDAFLQFPIAYEEESKEAANEPTSDAPQGE